jgi:hypothetical protein
VTETAEPGVARSHRAAELRLLPKQARAPLRVHPELVVLVDAVVTACALLVDDQHPRPWHERFEDLEGLLDVRLSDSTALNGLTQRMERFCDPPYRRPAHLDPEDRRSRFGNRFLLRILGPLLPPT